MEQKQGRQLVIYSRKSRYTGKGESIENQIEMCRQYIAVHYGTEEAENARIYEDEGFSGGNLDRPQFQNMMKDARTKRFSAIVVYRLDRISRNIGDFAKLIEQLNSMRIDFVSIKEQFDTGSPMGRAMMYISSVFSQLERETIAERIRDNMHELAKSGRWLGGTTPTGYSSVHVSTVMVDGKTKRACKLQILPEECRMVRLIYDQFLETGSLSQVDAFLMERGYVTKCGKPFSRFSIKNILSNPVYMIADVDAYEYLQEKGVELFSRKEDFDGVCGIMAYNRTLQQPGKAQERKPMEAWIVTVGQHEGLIPGKMWVQVQVRLAQNRSKDFHRTRSHTALLSGVLRCGHCGDYMRPKQGGRELPQGERVFSYLCSTKERSKKACCQMENPNGNLLDRLVLEEIKKRKSDRGMLVKHLERNKKLLWEDRTDCEAELEALRTEQKATETEIRTLVEKLSRLSGAAAETYIMQRIEDLHRETKQRNNRMEELEANATAQALGEQELERLCHLLLDFGGSLAQQPVEQKRAAIRSLVRSVVWDGQCAHVYLIGSEIETDEVRLQKPLGENSK